MRATNAGLAAALLLLAACTGSEKTSNEGNDDSASNEWPACDDPSAYALDLFYTDFAVTVCERKRQCDSLVGTYQECLESVEPGDPCCCTEVPERYDPEQACTCIEALLRSDCDQDFPDECLSGLGWYDCDYSE